MPTTDNLPTANGLLLLFIAWLGPTVGPFALILFAAAAGSLWPLSRRPEESTGQAITYVASAALLALVFVGPTAQVLSGVWKEAEVHILLAPLAACVGLFRDQVIEGVETAMRAALAGFVDFIKRWAGGRAGQ